MQKQLAAQKFGIATYVQAASFVCMLLVILLVASFAYILLLSLVLAALNAEAELLGATQSCPRRRRKGCLLCRRRRQPLRSAALRGPGCPGSGREPKGAARHLDNSRAATASRLLGLSLTALRLPLPVTRHEGPSTRTSSCFFT